MLVYDERAFRERFRMSRNLCTRIVREVTDHSRFFQQTPSCASILNISPLMKYNEVNPDALDEYLQIGATTSCECLQKFCE